MSRLNGYSGGNVIRVATIMMLWVMVSHWIGCLWFLIGWNSCPEGGVFPWDLVTEEIHNPANRTWITVYWPQLLEVHLASQPRLARPSPHPVRPNPAQTPRSRQRPYPNRTEQHCPACPGPNLNALHLNPSYSNPLPHSAHLNLSPGLARPSRFSVHLIGVWLSFKSGRVGHRAHLYRVRAIDVLCAVYDELARIWGRANCAH